MIALSPDPLGKSLPTWGYRIGNIKILLMGIIGK
jgi:hypothetical protein